MLSRKDMAETVLKERSQLGETSEIYDLGNPGDLDTVCSYLASSWELFPEDGLSDSDVANVLLGALWGSTVKAGPSNLVAFMTGCLCSGCLYNRLPVLRLPL